MYGPEATHHLWIKHPVAFDAAQRAAADAMLRLCHIVPLSWESRQVAGLSFDQVAVCGDMPDVARAAQILQALHQFVYLSSPPISIGTPAAGFPLPEVTSYRAAVQPGWARGVVTGDPAMYLIGASDQGLVVGQYPVAGIPLGGLLWHDEAPSPEAAVAAWVQATMRQRPRVVLAEPQGPHLWRIAYQV